MALQPSASDNPGPGDSAASNGSVHAIPDFEASSYYKGISSKPPYLLYRTGRDRYPFVRHEGSEAWKSMHGVFGTPFNDFWGTVGPLVRDFIKAQKIRWTSINVARFVTHNTEEEDVLDPIVIWVSVYPGSTTPDSAHDASEDILNLLKNHGIEDVEVEWFEGVVERL